jgi:hypothetical protein
MNNYFLLSGKNTSKLTSAFAPEGTKLAHELIQDLDGLGELPFQLELYMLSEGQTGLIKKKELNGLNEIWLDYQPNSLAWPLVSEKMKAIIINHLTGNETIEWITAKVIGNGEVRKYYIPRFQKKLDVLDMQKTMFVQGTDKIIRPCFSLSKVKNYNVFNLPSSYNLWKITPSIYVSEMLKKAMQKEKLAGIDFEKTMVA